jgi:Short-chain dehydrogenases of various substrate specificities
MRQVALITGCSSGIGYETALTLARNGFCTYAGVRNTKNSDTLENKKANEKLDLNILQLDVNDNSSIENAVNQIKTKEKRIDVLINNAGYGLVGFFEELRLDEIRSQFETNFSGSSLLLKRSFP